MNFLKKLMSFIKNIFNKNNNVEQIEEAKENTNIKAKIDFEESLKIVTNKKKKKVETLVCNGDGLGIQKNITF